MGRAGILSFCSTRFKGPDSTHWGAGDVLGEALRGSREGPAVSEREKHHKKGVEWF